MTARPRVLWLIKGLGRGGAEMLLVSLARAMDKHAVGLDVAYVLPHKDALVRPLQEQGVGVRCLAGARRGDWVHHLRRYLAEGRFDIVHTHAPVVGSAARLLAPRGTLLVHTEHNVWDRYHAATRWANAVTLPRNRAVWAVSGKVAGSIRMPGPARLHPPVEVMLHGVDPAQAFRGPEARRTGLRLLGLEPGPFTVGTVGNLTPKKNHASLLRAFAGLHQLVPDSRLVVVGTGPAEAELRDGARRLGVSGAVHFTGMREDVPAVLPALDLFVMSSLHEGLSIALIEALAAGLPVVATRVGGIPEVITHDLDGLLVPPADDAALLGAMKRLVEDGRLRARLAQAGLNRSADFGIETAADSLTLRYRELCRGTLGAEAVAG